jgi:AmmeMemoRadiSam system protein A
MDNNYVYIAQKAIEEYLKTGRKIKVEYDKPNQQNLKGVFVSLKKKGQLRGCIGTIRGRYPLEEEIVNNAIAAATEDPRFYPVTPDEMKLLEISVDVLEPEEVVDDFSELDPEIYGVIVEQGYKRGLLLPNLEGVNTVEDQIRIAKDKAGISGDDYNIKRFKVTRYGREKG